MRMRVLLLGGESRLGQALLSQAAAESIRVDTPARPKDGWLADTIDDCLDIFQPDLVIDLAYYHEQFQLSLHNELLLASQRAYGEQLVSACSSRGIINFMVSSTRVFDGLKKTTYTERDEPAPGESVGELQAALEKLIRNAGDRYLILRFSWLLDSSPDGQFSRLLKQLQHQDPVQLAEEWRGNPTPVADAARVMLAVLKQLDCEAPVHGVYHYGSIEPTTWISFAQSVTQELLATHRLDKDPVIQPMPFNTQPMAGLEPQNASLVSRKMLMTYGIKPRSWRSQLPDLLKSVESA